MPSPALHVLFLSVVVAVALVDIWVISRLMPERFSRAWRLGLASAGMGVWLTGHALIAQSGVLDDPTGVPPRLGLYVVGIGGVVGAVALGRLGRRLGAGVPWGVWIGLQTFRLPLEVWLHGMHQEGIVPVQMTWSGWNFDVVTGATAPFVAWWVVRQKPGWRVVFWVWNVFGMVCLGAILGIAVTSAPTALFSLAFWASA